MVQPNTRKYCDAEPLQIRKRYIKVQLQLEPMDGKWLTANMK